MEVLVALVALCFTAVSGSSCDLAAPLPKSVPLSYVEKISTWYQTVSSNDPISAQYICGTASRVNMNYDSESFTALTTKYYSKAKPRQFNVYIRKTTDGHYERLEVDHREIPTLVNDQYGRWNIMALQEDYHVSRSLETFALVGDGASYFAPAKCTPEGWAVWIYTPQKVLTTEELLYIRNELVKNGIHTELRLGKCEGI